MLLLLLFLLLCSLTCCCCCLPLAGVCWGEGGGITNGAVRSAVHTLLINNCCHEFSTRRFLLLRCLYFKIYLFVQHPHTHTHRGRERETERGGAARQRQHTLLLERCEECIWSDNVIRILNWGAFPVRVLLTCICRARFSRCVGILWACSTSTAPAPAPAPSLSADSPARLCCADRCAFLAFCTSVLLVLRALHYYAQVNHRRRVCRDASAEPRLCGSLSNLVGFLYPLYIELKGIINRKCMWQPIGGIRHCISNICAISVNIWVDLRRFVGMNIYNSKTKRARAIIFADNVSGYCTHMKFALKLKHELFNICKSEKKWILNVILKLAASFWSLT